MNGPCDDVDIPCPLALDTVLAVYQGTILSGLTEVASNEYVNNSGNMSQVALPALTEGDTYYFQIASSDYGESDIQPLGDIHLGWYNGDPAPVNTSLPTISGTAAIGETLTASHGSWNYSPTGYAYQWQRCRYGDVPYRDAACSSWGTWEDISGEIGSSYVVTSGDTEYVLRMLVTAENTWGQASAGSEKTDMIDYPAAGSYTAAVNGNDPTSFWRLDDANGSVKTAADSVGSNDGSYDCYFTLGGDCSSDNPAYIPTDVSGATSDGDHAAHIATSGPSNTINGYMEVPYTSDLNAQNFGIDFWVKFDEPLTEEATAVSSRGLDGLGYHVTVSLHQIQLNLSTLASCTAPLPDEGVTDSEWHHIGVSYDETTQRATCEYDGAWSTENTGNWANTQNTSRPFYGGNLLQGWDSFSLDDLAYYDHFVSGARFRQHFLSR